MNTKTGTEKLIGKKNKGYTLIELLSVIAIMVVLGAITIPMGLSYRPIMKLRSLDKTAREIFMAAQNRAEQLRASGTLKGAMEQAWANEFPVPSGAPTPTPTNIFPLTVSAENQFYHSFVTDPDKALISDRIAKSTYDYKIVYSAAGKVSRVFVTKKGNWPPTEDLAKIADMSFKERVKDFPDIGYYGIGNEDLSDLPTLDTGTLTLTKPVITIQNGDKLRAIVKCVAPVDKKNINANGKPVPIRLELKVEGSALDTNQPKVMLGRYPGLAAGTPPDGSIALVPVTSEPETSDTYKIHTFEFDLTDLEYYKVKYANFKITAAVFPNYTDTLYTNYAEMNSKFIPSQSWDEGNGLFAGLTPKTAGDETGAVSVSCARHLKNVNAYISDLSKTIDGKTLDDVTKAKLKTEIGAWPKNAVQLFDIDCSPGKDAGGTIIKSDPGELTGLNSYNGQGFTISNFITADGLFGDKIEKGKYTNISIRNAECTGSNNSAGILAGTVTGDVVFDNILIENSSVNKTKNALANAGGVVGETKSATVEDVTYSPSFGKVTVYNTSVYGNNAGGVAGTSNGAKYGALKDASANTEDKLINVINTKVVSSVAEGNAGGVVGSSTGDTFTNCRVFLTPHVGTEDINGNTANNADEAAINFAKGYIAQPGEDGKYPPSLYNYVISGYNAGGIAGKLSGTAEIKNSFAATLVGGNIGTTDAVATAAGGLIGASENKVDVEKSYADCYIKGASAGGIMGSASGSGTTITNCYSAGFIEMFSTAGEGAGAAYSTAAGVCPTGNVSVSNFYTAMGYVYNDGAGGKYPVYNELYSTDDQAGNSLTYPVTDIPETPDVTPGIVPTLATSDTLKQALNAVSKNIMPLTSDPKALTNAYYLSREASRRILFPAYDTAEKLSVCAVSNKELMNEDAQKIVEKLGNTVFDMKKVVTDSTAADEGNKSTPYNFDVVTPLDNYIYPGIKGLPHYGDWLVLAGPVTRTDPVEWKWSDVTENKLPTGTLDVALFYGTPEIGSLIDGNKVTGEWTVFGQTLPAGKNTFECAALGGAKVSIEDTSKEKNGQTYKYKTLTINPVEIKPGDEGGISTPDVAVYDSRFIDYKITAPIITNYEPAKADINLIMPKKAPKPGDFIVDTIGANKLARMPLKVAYNFTVATNLEWEVTQFNISENKPGDISTLKVTNVGGMAYLETPEWTVDAYGAAGVPPAQTLIITYTSNDATNPITYYYAYAVDFDPASIPVKNEAPVTPQDVLTPEYGGVLPPTVLPAEPAVPDINVVTAPQSTPDSDNTPYSMEALP